jgi:folate-binding protein YgfZ
MTATTGIESDYAVLTKGVGLLDRSERGKLALTGPDAKEFLHGQVTQDMRALTPGHGRYAAFLTQKGKMLGDLRVLDADQELLLDTERVALQALFNMIRRYSVGYYLELHKRTLESGLLSLIGPGSDELVSEAAGAVPGPQEHDHLELDLADVRLRAIRTDLGIDLLVGADDLESVRDVLVRAGAAEVQEAAAECLRIESGRPRYGVDLDEGAVIPQEAGLNERAVSFTKGCYVGQETVARLFYKGKPNRELRGLRSSEPLALGTELTYEERVVGTVTSSALSPSLGAIALSLVRREAPVGTTVQARGPGSGREHDVLIAELPLR